ncbi:MAG: DUF4406 domain-containing protein [Candidatus Buchananbacteria bacterium]|nr:DUF4406 domain-containing protein [Candidatus Buchananbacteria bacterium]
MRLFISGPIDGVPLNRLRRFDDVKRFLEQRGHQIITEIDVPYPDLNNADTTIAYQCDKEPELLTWLILLTKKMWIMTQCDILFLLPGWEVSHDASVLFVTAKKLEMPIYIDDGSAIKLTNEDEIKSWFEKQINNE